MTSVCRIGAHPAGAPRHRPSTGRPRPRRAPGSSGRTVQNSAGCPTA